LRTVVAAAVWAKVARTSIAAPGVQAQWLWIGGRSLEG